MSAVTFYYAAYGVDHPKLSLIVVAAIGMGLGYAVLYIVRLFGKHRDKMEMSHVIAHDIATSSRYRQLITAICVIVGGLVTGITWYAAGIDYQNSRLEPQPIATNPTSPTNSPLPAPAQTPQPQDEPVPTPPLPESSEPDFIKDAPVDTSVSRSSVPAPATLPIKDYLPIDEAARKREIDAKQDDLNFIEARSQVLNKQIQTTLEHALSVIRSELNSGGGITPIPELKLPERVMYPSTQVTYDHHSAVIYHSDQCTIGLNFGEINVQTQSASTSRDFTYPTIWISLTTGERGSILFDTDTMISMSECTDLQQETENRYATQLRAPTGDDGIKQMIDELLYDYSLVSAVPEKPKQ
jgi:hypothetical protein